MQHPGHQNSISKRYLVTAAAAKSLQSCPTLCDPRDGGAWWAAVYGVAQSWTRLKRQQYQYLKTNAVYQIGRASCRERV